VNDKFFPEGSMLFQYEGTFMFDAVTSDLPTDLPRGQVIVRGVALRDGNFDPLKPLTFAIVGGTAAYEGASGQVFSLGQTAVCARSRSCCDRVTPISQVCPGPRESHRASRPLS
jgi:hypothetical protein